MSYTSQVDPRSRATAIAGVAAVHVAMGLAVVIGLAATGVIGEKDGPLISYDLDDPLAPPPPTSEPTEMVDPITPPMAAPSPKFDFPTDNRADAVEADPDARIIDVPYVPSTGTDFVVQPPKPSPSATFTPTSPVPAGNAGSWITTADYPASPLRRGIEGVTGYRLVIGTNGKVNACEITASSGNAQLDEATCSKLTRRARFTPATDSSGAKVVGNFNGVVRWQIPD